MDKKGVLTLLGFAQKGKNLAAGEANVEAYLKKGKVCLLLIAEDQSVKISRSGSFLQKMRKSKQSSLGRKKSLVMRSAFRPAAS